MLDNGGANDDSGGSRKCPSRLPVFGTLTVIMIRLLPPNLLTSFSRQTQAVGLVSFVRGVQRVSGLRPNVNVARQSRNSAVVHVAARGGPDVRSERRDRADAAVADQPSSMPGTRRSKWSFFFFFYSKCSVLWIARRS